MEDPVEYRVSGVNQTQVNSKTGMTFAAGLRALLRQDPNIIMVGEIRDGETADLAVQAALTGHVVLSTLHTNNAATTLPPFAGYGTGSLLDCFDGKYRNRPAPGAAAVPELPHGLRAARLRTRQH